MADEETVAEPAAKKLVVVEQPEWYKELVAGTRHVLDDAEPEVVTRARGE
jgi:hypothetical protein